MVYRHCYIRPKLHHIASTVEYLQIKLAGRVVGMCANVSRTLLKEQTKGYYFRYFSFLPGFRVEELPKTKKNKNSVLKQEINNYLAALNIGLTYAYVDLNNLRSRAICDLFNFQEAGQFSTIIFSRIFPKAANNISKIDFMEVKELLCDHYRDYNLFTIDNIKYEHADYYVLKRDGRILAGIAATKERWKILNIPSALGKVLLKVKIPFLRRLFNTDYRFLAIEGIYARQGCENELSNLLEGVLQVTGHNIAMMWADIKSPLYRTLKSLPLGILSKFKSEVKASVIVRNYEAGKPLKNIYISGFDLT
ncbi:hypothetical protein C900_04692 [Fulvivirga imtechensis AK7]|uniref:Uncharacterized protein n=2 Tax=Fulvivirga TaxID=396811 RepID=L8JLN0_9BACT|nr:hypothetical protein C900_04692 [Fulvivirga imtechensis AK7]